MNNKTEFNKNNVLSTSKFLSINDKRILDLALNAGVILMRSGAETYRVEETVGYILALTNQKQIDVNSLMTSLQITLTTIDGHYITAVRRIHRRDFNLRKIEVINQMSRSLISNNISIEEAENIIKNIDNEILSIRNIQIATIFAAITFTLMMGGGYLDLIAGSFGGIILVLSTSFFQLSRRLSFISNFIYAFCVSMIMNLLSRIFYTNYHADLVIIATLMIQFPGTAMTNSIRDTLKGDYLSGGGRAIEALVVAISLALGTAFGLYLSGGVGHFTDINGQWNNIYTTTIGAGLSTYCCSYIFGASLKISFANMINGAIGWAIYFFTLNSYGPIISTLFAGISVSFIAQILARVLKKPVTMSLIPSIYPIVPGIAIYRTAFYFLSNNSGPAWKYASQSLLIAGAIALSILFAESIFVTIYKFYKRIINLIKNSHY